MTRWPMILWGVWTLSTLPGPGLADSIKPIFYAQMVAAQAKLEDFKSLFSGRDRPVSGTLQLPDFDIGKSLLGQRVEIKTYAGAFFDALAGLPSSPIWPMRVKSRAAPPP